MSLFDRKAPRTTASVVAGDQAMRAKQQKPDKSYVFSQSTPGITPYLGLQAKLSQVWINKWTVLLLLVLVRTLFAVESLHNGVQDAKKEALSACMEVESMGSALASIPHYMAQGVNELTAASVDKAVHGLLTLLNLSVIGVEEIVVFMINTLTQTYLCLITLAVSGGLHIAIDVAEDVTAFLNKTIASVGTDIISDFNSFQTEMNKFTQMLDKFPQLFGTDATIPQLNINGSLTALNKIVLPASVNQGLDKLNASIPTFAQVNNFTQTALRLPFEDVKNLLNASYGSYTLNRSLFPVPQKETLSFCTDNNDIDKFFNKILEVGIIARRIALAVLLILATVACVPMAYRETRRWRSNQAQARVIARDNCDHMDAVYIVSRPYTATAGLSLANRVTNSRRQTIVRWTVAYATTVPALFVLSLGLAALFSCLCQYIIVKAVQREVPELSYEIGEFAEKVINTVNNASVHWANGTNQVILDMNNDLNKDVFHWVNVSTTALNNTLNVFVDDTINVLNSTFGGTVLYNPITEVFNCLIGLKVAGIEKALTWAQDHAYADFSLLPNNTFSLGAAANATSINGTSSANALFTNPAQSATDSVTSAVNWLLQKLLNAIRQEAIIAGCMVLVYLIVVLIGLIRAVSLLFFASKHDNANRDTKEITLQDLNPNGGHTGGAAIHRPTTPVPRMFGAANPFTDSPPRYVSPARVPVNPTVPQSNDVNPGINTGNTYRGLPYTLPPRAAPSVPGPLPLPISLPVAVLPYIPHLQTQSQSQPEPRRPQNTHQQTRELQDNNTSSSSPDLTPIDDETLTTSEAEAEAEAEADVAVEVEVEVDVPTTTPKPARRPTVPGQIETMKHAPARPVGAGLVKPGPRNVRLSSYADLRGAATLVGVMSGGMDGGGGGGGGGGLGRKGGMGRGLADERVTFERLGR